MQFLYNFSVALSIGIMIGFFCGALKLSQKKSYTKKRIDASKRFQKKVSTVLKYITILLLILGLVWYSYFLILGAIDSSQSEYATNMSQLIVSVLTVVSIIFAFFEFIRRLDDGLYSDKEHEES